MKYLILTICLFIAACGDTPSADNTDTSQAPTSIIHGPAGDTYTWSNGYTVTYPK